MNNELLIDINQYPGAVMYAKLHNISFNQLVDNFLAKFQVPSAQAETSKENTDEFLETIDEQLMMQTFETAHQDYLAGRCIPNSQVVDYIKSELGWK